MAAAFPPLVVPSAKHLDISEEGKYKKFEDFLDHYTKTFKCEALSIDKITKHVFEENANLFLKGDIHGDLDALNKYLEHLFQSGYLEKLSEEKGDYKIIAEKNVVLGFLGDYIDKGEDSIGVLEVVMRLKLNNPDSVILIRGNHEGEECFNRHEGSLQKYCTINPSFKSKLLQCFSHFPTCSYVGVKYIDEKGKVKIKYVCLSHGTIDPTINISDFLQTANMQEQLILNERKIEASVFSEVIAGFKNKFQSPIDFFDDTVKFLVKNPNEILFNKFLITQLKEEFKEIQYDKLFKEAQLYVSALKINEFIKSNLELFERHNYYKASVFSFADVTNLNRGLVVGEDVVQNYFNLINNDNFNVALLRLGHAHIIRDLTFENELYLIRVLPATYSFCFKWKDYDLDYAETFDKHFDALHLVLKEGITEATINLNRGI
jgi:hypothetical protein